MLEQHWLDQFPSAAPTAAKEGFDLDAEELECPACGKRFANGPLRCPGCGLRFG